jgi:hypothetical protein
LLKEGFLLPPGEGHDCRDAGGRAPKVGALGDAGAVAEEEGISIKKNFFLI